MNSEIQVIDSEREVFAAAEALCGWLRGETPPVADWGAVIRLAARQGLAAVLYKQLKAAGTKSQVPPEQWTLLQETYFDSAGRSLRRQHQIARVLRAFQEASIPVIALKGAHLGAVVYDDPALRPMQDLDVLVKPEDLPRAEALLQGQGYTLYGEREEYERGHYHFHYHLPDPAELPVELHWQLLRPDTPHIKLEMDELWSRAGVMKLAGIQTLVLAPEDLLLYLCLHTALNHLFEGGLKTCYDLLKTITYFGAALDWDSVQVRARLWQVNRPVSVMLYQANKWLSVTISEPMLYTLEQATIETELLTWVEERMLLPEPPWIPAESPPPAFRSSNLAAWQGLDWQDRIALVWRSLLPARTILAQRYAIPSEILLPFFYVRNWVDMLFEHTPVLWRLLHKEAHTMALAEEKLNWDKTVHVRATWDAKQSAIEQWLAAT